MKAINSAVGSQVCCACRAPCAEVYSAPHFDPYTGASQRFGLWILLFAWAWFSDVGSFFMPYIVMWVWTNFFISEKTGIWT